jgi:hypothetical protein
MGLDFIGIRNRIFLENPQFFVVFFVYMPAREQLFLSILYYMGTF